MSRTLYLHIGAHRTATTSTQKFLRVNANTLAKRGVFLPSGVGRHFDLFNRLFSGVTPVAKAARNIDERAEARQQPIHSVVLSDEDVCTRRDLSVLTGFAERFDVKVIFSMRRQDLWLESWYQQNVKWQWNPALAHLPFPEFLARRDEFFWIDYNAMIERLEGLFGAENVIPLVFERGQMPEGPVAAFCDAIGIDDLTGFEAPEHSNTSLSPVMTEFMRNMPLDELPGPVRRVFEQACSRADRHLEGVSRSTLFLPHADRAALMDSFAPGNRALAQRRFGRDHLFLDPLPAPDAELAPQRLPDNSYETMAGLVAPFVQSLALGISDLAPPRDTSIAGGSKPAPAKAGKQAGQPPKGQKPAAKKPAAKKPAGK